MAINYLIEFCIMVYDTNQDNIAKVYRQPYQYGNIPTYKSVIMNLQSHGLQLQSSGYVKFKLDAGKRGFWAKLK